MKLLILGLNYAPERVGIAVYTAGMAEALAAAGHEVQVVAGRPYYPGWKILEGHNAFTYSRGKENGVDVTRVPHYIPQNPSGTRRLLHHAIFAITSFFPMLWRAAAWSPDVVMTIAPSLIAAPIARLAAGLCGARSWLHIQDFEVEAAFATGLLADGGRPARAARWFERQVIQSFDTVSSISPQMCRKLIEKGIEPDRVVEFRNWADIDAIRPMERSSSFRAEWNVETPHVALYSGNIANKQGIEIVVEAARRLKDRRDLTFIVCGEGPNKANLEAQAGDLDNIQFHNLQPKERLNDLLGLATIHLLPQMAGAADLVLPSKLTNMLASGRPVVATAEKGTGLYDEVEGCGIMTKPGDVEAFAAGITMLIAAPPTYQSLAASARARAEARWGAREILSRLEARLFTSSFARPARSQNIVRDGS
ncbi:WcaI family glycosyltransferase [Pelagibacterium limicola]|uniref:WcaI family glycosyltransferase n=1 Tax=Pelagibacterium limicola TaxID=2791022 RepID=UPI0018AFA49C|nr:WcaI family glycosyltransferase [Pelagibacterium limicola]